MAECIELNDQQGLGMISEEGLEVLHKDLRRFRCDLARKQSLSENLRDSFHRLWLQSEPMVRKFEKKIKCSRCLADDHGPRSCPQRNYSCAREYDANVTSFYLE